MGSKARRREHFPKMKVRGNNGRFRELEWSITMMRDLCIRMVSSYVGVPEPDLGTLGPFRFDQISFPVVGSSYTRPLVPDVSL